MPLVLIAVGIGIMALAHTAPFPFLLEWIGPGRSVWHQSSPDGVPTIDSTVPTKKPGIWTRIKDRLTPGNDNPPVEVAPPPAEVVPPPVP